MRDHFIILFDGTPYRFSVDERDPAGTASLSVEKADRRESGPSILFERGAFPALGLSQAGETSGNELRRIILSPRAGENLDEGTTARLSSISREIREELATRKPGSDAMAAALALQFLTIVSRALASGPSGLAPGGRAGNGVWSISDAIRHIEGNYTDSFDLDFFVSACALNVSDFSRRFKEEAGCPLFEFINRQRIRHACALLKSSDMTIIEVSSAVGYNNLSFFNRYFLRIMGVSPRAFRSKST